MTKVKTFLHVGYPKCASTFIQDYYFIPENKFIGLVDNSENGGEWRDYLNCQLVTAQNSWFNSSHPEIPSIPEASTEWQQIEQSDYYEYPLFFATKKITRKSLC